MLLRKIPGGLPETLKHSKAIWRGYSAVVVRQTSSVVSDGILELNLLGPPELHHSASFTERWTQDLKDGVPYRSATATTTESSASSMSSDPFMNAMLQSYNRTNLNPLMGRTENYSPTYLSSMNPCLDFFFHVVPGTPSINVTEMLKLAWEHDPSTALKLIFNLGGVRGTGKSDREGFYTSALWLQENHPKTLAGNIGSVPKFGYFKNLPEILYRLVEGPKIRSDQKAGTMKTRDGRVFNLCRTGGRLEAASKGKEKYENDPKYRFLHNCVTELFAQHLKTDLEKLRSGQYNDLSLAAKWCPSLYSSYDNSTLICEGIARRLFPKEKYPEYEQLEDAHYAYRVRDRLRKEVLVPLRSAQKLPEVYMSARQWSSIVYTRVASIAMRNYAKLFYHHDKERFLEYLRCVARGGKRIAAGALLPHEILKDVQQDSLVTRIVANEQWKRIVEDLSAIGKLKNCLAICDVSASMYGLPMEVSVALGLLVSELSEEPWKGKLITFSRIPQLQVIEGQDLQSKISFIKNMEWGMNTDFQRVFDRILEVAVQSKLTEDQMIKRLFVFSDMEFDEASANDWETDYQAIVRKFKEKGYMKVPEIVFWNLRYSSATPVLSQQEGVAMVSGFSKNLLKIFLSEGEFLESEDTDDSKQMAEVLDPVKQMEAAISGEEYEKLVVLD